MKFRTVLILLLLVALGGGALYVLQSTPHIEQKQVVKTIPFPEE